MLKKFEILILLGVLQCLTPAPEEGDFEVEPHITAGITRQLEETKVQASIEASEVEKVAVNNVQISDVEQKDYILIRATGYVLDGTTASGKQVYEGCVATCNQWFGKTIDVYAVNEDGSVGDYIRTLHADDKGGDARIQNGQRIDIWFPSLDAAYDHINRYGDYVYIVVRGE